MKKIILWLVLGGLFFGEAGELQLTERFKKVVVRNELGNMEVKGTWIMFQDVPVLARKRYRVKIQARVKNGSVLENIPAMAELLPHVVWQKEKSPWKIAEISYEYRSEDKRLWSLYHGAGVPIFSKDFRDYFLDFYAFDGADAVRIFIRANDLTNTVEVKQAEISEVDMNAEKYLNANSELNLGTYNPTGYGYAHEATFGNDAAGPFIDVGTRWAVGDSIPVIPGDRLKISYGGEVADNRPFMRINAHFFKSPLWKKENDIGVNKLPMRITREAKEGTSEIIVPENATWLRLEFQNGALRYIRVEKVNK